MNRPDQQRGIALVLAMLVVSIVTVMAVRMLNQQNFLNHRSANQLQFNQAGYFVLGMEDWASQFLQKDFKDSKIDHLDENWAIPLPQLPIEGGFISGYLQDAHSKLNLNTLLQSELNQQRLKRLCEDLEVDPAFIPALLDWMDADQEPRYPDGAEDDTYLALEVPYRVANQALQDISELRQISALSSEDFAKLAPFVIALPDTSSSMNINTLPSELLATLDEELAADAIDRIIEERESEAFSSIDKMMERTQINLNAEGLDVRSQFFLANGQAVQGDISYLLYSLLYRDKSKGSVSTVYRRLGPF